jgi:hypothetical protein
MKRVVWLTSALILALPLAAAAQEIPCGEGPCIKLRPPGTHFLVEVNGGGTLFNDGGLAVEGLVGVGGKLRGFPPRFYLIAEFDYSTNAHSGELGWAPGGYNDERDFRDVVGGLRIYVPIWGGLRWFVDGVGGGSYQVASLSRDQLPLREVRAWVPLVAVATGLQWRLFHHMAVGLRSKFVLNREDPGGLYAMVGEEPPLRTTLTLGLTWHF